MNAMTLQKSCFALVAILILLTMSASIAQAQVPNGPLGQIFGALSTGGASGGSDAYLTTPDPYILPLSGAWSVALTATGSYPSIPFIEVGAIKNCSVGCSYHPYWSYANNTGFRDFRPIDGIYLSPGGWYRYINYYIGNNQWQGQFCDANGCTVILVVTLGVSGGMPFEASGGESIDTWTSIGTSTSNNRWWNIYAGVWSNYCYNTVQKNVGTITPCGNNFDWSVYWLIAGKVLLPIINK